MLKKALLAVSLLFSVSACTVADTDDLRTVQSEMNPNVDCSLVRCAAPVCDPGFVANSLPSGCCDYVCVPEAPQTGRGLECTHDDDCRIAGCSSQICVGPEDDGISTCEFRAEYACYGDAEVTSCGCNRGSCGWAQTDALDSCIADATP